MIKPNKITGANAGGPPRSVPPLAVKARTTRRFTWMLSGMVVLYVLSYCINSALGGYWGRPEMDGHDRYTFGLAMPTAILWQPRYGHLAMGRADFLGLAYSSLIWLDRRFVHQTIYISAPNGFDRVNHLSRERIHPEFRDMYDRYHTNSQPGGPANGSQPIRAETNGTSSAAGSRR